MNFVYYPMNLEMEISSRQINMLVLENRRILDEFIISLYNRCQKKTEEIEIIYKSKILDFTKISEIIMSPLDMTFDKRDVQKKVLQEVVEQMQMSEETEELAEIRSKWMGMVEKIQYESSYELEIDEDLGTDNILKCFHVRLKEPEGSFAERLLNYTQTIHRLLGKEVFFLVGCGQYLESQEIDYLYKQACYEEISIVMIENRQIKLSCETKEYIIDEDICEIH